MGNSGRSEPPVSKIFVKIFTSGAVAIFLREIAGASRGGERVVK